MTKILGQCIGNPGLPACGKQIFDDDPDAMELEDKRFMCGECLDKQFPALPKKPQGPKGAFIGAKRKGGKASAKRSLARPHVKPGFCLPGSKNFTD